MIQLQKAVGTVSQMKHTSRHKYLKQGAWLFDFFKNKYDGKFLKQNKQTKQTTAVISIQILCYP